MAVIGANSKFTDGNLIESVDGAQAKVNAHENKQNNPHNVTTEQVNTLAANSKKAADLPSTYPVGVTVFTSSVSTDGFPTASGVVITSKSADTRYITQTYQDSVSGSRQFFRTAISNNAWGAWVEQESITGSQSKVDAHANNSTIHVTSSEKTDWNGKINSTEKGKVNGVAKLNASGKVTDSSGNVVESLDTQKPLTLKTPESSTSHTLEHYKLDGEDTEIFKIRRNGQDYTVFEIDAPSGEGIKHREATLTLMRQIDPDTLAPEFLDLYNINYEDSKQYGIRIQSRGAGQQRDFVFDFYDGKKFNEAMRISPDSTVKFKGNQQLQSAVDQVVDFIDENGSRKGYIGSVVEVGDPNQKRMVLLNRVGGSSIEIYDSGEIIVYSAKGDINFYLDGQDKWVYVNGERVETAGGAQAKVNTHANNADIHFTSAERTKLGGVATGANNYIHPASHPASMITESTTKRFVTDSEKSTWNGKANNETATTTKDGLMSSADKTKLNGVESGANNYAHPTTHPASMITGLADVAKSGDITNTIGMIHAERVETSLYPDMDEAIGDFDARISDANSNANARLHRAGGTMIGVLEAQSNTSYSTRQVRNVILSTGDAENLSMQNGDIWIKYK